MNLSSTNSLYLFNCYSTVEVSRNKGIPQNQIDIVRHQNASQCFIVLPILFSRSFILPADYADYIYGKFMGLDAWGEKVDLADTTITSEKQMHEVHTEMEISHVKLDKGRAVHVLALILMQFNNKVS